MLETERAFYNENLPEWSDRYAGKVVVVSGRELLGVFSTIEEALAAGVARLGMRPFLVRPVGESEQEVVVPALTLGVLGADPTHPDQRTR
ncbi:MAG: hypothetical protein KatS3mg076_2195 [Candidatus Binatia bacterium]|nr:MAG: hypothetical protein KatS3mg076_2195 [Candidatus Binatia bacterium]